MLEIKQQSKQCLEAGGRAPKKAITVSSAGEVMATMDLQLRYSETI